MGGLQDGLWGAETKRTALVAAASEEDGRGVGRMRVQHSPDAWAYSPHGFVLASFERGSVVHTDGWDG